MQHSIPHCLHALWKLLWQLMLVSYFGIELAYIC